MYDQIIKHCQENSTKLIAVSKTISPNDIRLIYDKGQRDFGENRVQELLQKVDQLPEDIQWHMIGHLQRNKVKYIAPFIALIHSVDSETLLDTINEQAFKNDRVIDILLQVKIAVEDSKYGLDETGCYKCLKDIAKGEYPHVNLRGYMGMATFTNTAEQVREEFQKLKKLAAKWNAEFELEDASELSMGMSGDYEIAIEEGSTMIRIGSLIFDGNC